MFKRTFSSKILTLFFIGLLTLALGHAHLVGVVQAQGWDFPRLDEIYFKIEYPYTVALEAAKACQIDTYVGAIRIAEVETLKDPPYNWTVAAAPGFHMCSIGINCRDVTPETSGGRVNNHNRKPGFDPNADLNNDDLINMADISIVIDHFLDEI